MCIMSWSPIWKTAKVEISDMMGELMQGLVETHQADILRKVSALKKRRDMRDTEDVHRFVPSITPYFSSPRITLYSGDAAEILSTLEEISIDCIVTSPPYY